INNSPRQFPTRSDRIGHRYFARTTASSWATWHPAKRTSNSSRVNRVTFCRDGKRKVNTYCKINWAAWALRRGDRDLLVGNLRHLAALELPDDIHCVAGFFAHRLLQCFVCPGNVGRQIKTIAALSGLTGCISRGLNLSAVRHPLAVFEHYEKH